jgi:hypothetical protein
MTSIDALVKNSKSSVSRKHVGEDMIIVVLIVFYHRENHGVLIFILPHSVILFFS